MLELAFLSRGSWLGLVAEHEFNVDVTLGLFMIMRYSTWPSSQLCVCQLLYIWMDLTSEICQGEEMVRYLYPMDGILHVITMERCTLLITTANKRHGLTRETGWLYFSITFFYLYYSTYIHTTTLQYSIHYCNVMSRNISMQSI